MKKKILWLYFYQVGTGSVFLAKSIFSCLVGSGPETLHRTPDLIFLGK